MILQGDCRDILKTLPDKSVHCVVTSPPYWGLRDYGVAGQIGLEKTPDEYVATMVQVFREAKRVLRDDGVLWLNLGDSYAADRGGTYMPAETLAGGISGKGDSGTMRGRGDDGYARRDCTKYGLKHKDLCGIPWRVAFALQSDGWYLRSDIIWHKPNPMPESVTDRPTKSHEYVFLMSKSARYFYDAEAVKEAATGTYQWGEQPYKCGDLNIHHKKSNAKKTAEEGTRNIRSVWTIATQPSSEPHFAMFPEALVVPCIKAGTSEHGVCSECGAPWERVVEKTSATPGQKAGYTRDCTMRNDGERAGSWTDAESKTIGFRSTCKCGREDRIQATVLDPFSGMATVGVVCNKLGRKYIGIELNPKYAGRSETRKDKAANMFSEVV